MDGGVGHTAWVPKARKKKSSGLKGLKQEETSSSMLIFVMKQEALPQYHIYLLYQKYVDDCKHWRFSLSKFVILQHIHKYFARLFEVLCGWPQDYFGVILNTIKLNKTYTIFSIPIFVLDMNKCEL